MNKKSIINYIEEEENKNIEEKSKKNLEIYINKVIEYIDINERKNYLSESEIENLSYNHAFNMDNRNKAYYYFSMLKEKNKIISIFLNDEDYNINTVKISLFVFNFNLSLTVNALFFNDEAIYEINQNGGSFDLSTQIVRIIISTVISVAIGSIVELLSLSHQNIIELRYFKDINKAKKEVPKLIKRLKIKYVLCYIISLFFNFIFFYYITAFCAIYSKIQIHMISDSLMSFLLTISYSIIFAMISTFIRNFSLQKENNIRKLFYLISWIISLI